MPSPDTDGSDPGSRSLRVVVTRPREDAETLVEALTARGHSVHHEPLLAIEARDDPAWPAGHQDAQALLITSANGLRAFARCDARRALPVFAVGDASAAAARAAGFTAVHSAAGTVEDLAQLVGDTLDPGAGPLLHPAAGKLAGDLQGLLAEDGFQVLRAVLYDAVPAQSFSEEFVRKIDSGLIDAVTFFSPRTAATFASLIAEAGLVPACRGVAAVCLSRAVAERLSGLPWAAVAVAEQPDQQALLARLDALAAKRE
ncbi:uroporphyrinogen-III synthase [Pelagibius sp.]|uniref:uroporphyrinogen-III synthase n=1 Tax=Pelagibius sp. TaxID=1931238 RepID=UPI003B50585A